MFYIDAKKLVDLSLEHEILHSHPDQPDTVFLTLDTDDGPQWALYDKESFFVFSWKTKKDKPFCAPHWNPKG